MKKAVSAAILVIMLSLALAGCGGGVKPQAGDWEGAVSFDLSTGINVVSVSFTVSESGDMIESWSMFDVATGSISFGQQVPIENGKFELDSTQYGNMLSITRHFSGTFTAVDAVEGKCELDYGNYGSYSGEWTAAPKAATP